MASLTLHTAELLLPMEVAPVPAAGVVVDEAGMVVEMGRLADIRSGYDSRHDHHLLMPGVLNCHVHLTDAARTEPVSGGEGLVRWAGRLLAERSEGPAPEKRHDAVLRLLARMREQGTVAVGEVANDFGTLEPIARSGMRCRLIQELIAFRGDLAGAMLARAVESVGEHHFPASIASTIGAHAPYSVSPALMRLIADEDARHGTFLYQHLAEDPAERELYEHGGGLWRGFLERLGSWDPSWHGTGMSPIAFYDAIGLLNDRFVAVHLADATPEEIALLAQRGAMAILSPYSNLHITGLLPPFESIVRSGMRFALGTDGRGSNPGSDVFGEARILLEHWPDLKPGALLEALTRSGAHILQFPELGVIRPGACPGLLAVELDAIPDDPGTLERRIIVDSRSRRPVA